MGIVDEAENFNMLEDSEAEEASGEYSESHKPENKYQAVTEVFQFISENKQIILTGSLSEAVQTLGEGEPLSEVHLTELHDIDLLMTELPSEEDREVSEKITGLSGVNIDFNFTSELVTYNQKFRDLVIKEVEVSMQDGSRFNIRCSSVEFQLLTFVDGFESEGDRIKPRNNKDSQKVNRLVTHPKFDYGNFETLVRGSITARDELNTNTFGIWRGMVLEEYKSGIQSDDYLHQIIQKNHPDVSSLVDLDKLSTRVETVEDLKNTDFAEIKRKYLIERFLEMSN